MRKKTLKKKAVLKSPLKPSLKETNKISKEHGQQTVNNVSSKRKLKKIERRGTQSRPRSKQKQQKQPNLQQIQDDDDYIYKEPEKRIIKPKDQLDLSEAELGNDISRILTGDDPNVPKNISKYSYKDRCFKLDPPGLSDHMAIHMVLEGCSLHVDSKEFKAQKDFEDRKKEIEEETRKSLEQQQQKGNNDQGTGGGGDVNGDRASSSDISPTPEAVFDNSKNQFNFSDRGTQTMNNKLRSRFVCTEPPPVAQYNENVSQWQIYDSYINELLLTQMEHSSDQSEETTTDESQLEDDDILRNKMSSNLKIVERLVNQNAQDEVYSDFKYWEDASDEFRKGEGSFLPLWRFAYERTKRKQVTSLCWNPGNPDLFAVGYGSFDFLQQGSGMICCYTLKNTSYPEYSYSIDSSVLCLDFHPQHPSLLAVGCYNGNVAVYDLSKHITQAIYLSSIQTGQHSDPVWEVYWQKEDIGKDLNFYSISSDGSVINWSLSKNDLQMEPVIQLKFDSSQHEDQDESVIMTGLAGGCCFDFSRSHENLFLVGTEEGNIHKCSKSYSGQYLHTYEGHHMAIYAVKWNPFHEDLFISCSADWTIKVSIIKFVFVSY